MTEATIGGTPVPLAQAIAAAADLLGGARCPVIAGLATDVAGAEAAVRLAASIGGVLDHTHSAALLRDLEGMREGGLLTTTPLQARARADLIVLLGSVGADDLGLNRLPASKTAGARRIIALDAARMTAEPAVALGILRALAADRPVRPDAPARAALAECAAALKAARYAVIAWSAGNLDALAIQMVLGLIDDLNATTRCAGLSMPAPANADGVVQTFGWRTGFPTRIGFGRGQAEHDPWRFDAERLVDSGEADAVLWVGAIPGGAPAWHATVPTIALACPGHPFAGASEIEIAVGRPGVDHESVLFDPRLGALAAVAASAPSAVPSAASVLSRVTAEIAASR